MPGHIRTPSRIRNRSAASLRAGWRRATPLATALASLALVGAGAAHAQPAAFSSGWFAAKGAAQANTAVTGRLPNGNRRWGGARQSQRASSCNARWATWGAPPRRSPRSRRPSAARDAAPATAARRRTAGGGRSQGGRQSLTAGWRNARAPVQTAANGRVNVAIEQTGEKAILNWETFNVGRNTTVQFRQDPNWAVLNRVNDPKARPSQIQGQIKADGTVMIVNRNGVVFDGGAQVNVRNLVAAALSDEQFQNNGLYSADGKTPGFTDALGKIELRPGAVIETSRPSTVTQSGGYVLLLGREVDNAGTITTPKGQAALAAGDIS